MKTKKRIPHQVYFNNEEFQSLRTTAELLGMKTSEYIRYRCLQTACQDQDHIYHDLAPILCELANAATELHCSEDMRKKLIQMEKMVWQSIK